MRHQKQLPASKVEIVARAYAVDDGAAVQALACTLLLATTLVAATLSVF